MPKYRTDAPPRLTDAAIRASGLSSDRSEIRVLRSKLSAGAGTGDLVDALRLAPEDWKARLRPKYIGKRRVGEVLYVRTQLTLNLVARVDDQEGKDILIQELSEKLLKAVQNTPRMERVALHIKC